MKRSKIFLLLSIGLILPIIANAKINVDIQGAPQLSNKLSFRAGVSVEIPVSDNLSLDPGLYYSMRHRQREVKLETTSSAGEILKTNSCELNAVANYLQLPIYISYNISTKNNDMQKIMFGPYFAYCIGGNNVITQKLDSTETSSLTSSTYPTFLDTRFDFGLAVEYKYILKSHFVFGLFAEIGMKNIFNSVEVAKDNDKWPVDSFHMNPGPKMNQSIGLSIGYRF